jgi:hypothetical protein
MKKALFVVASIVCVVIVVTGANVRSFPQIFPPQVMKKNCVGYTVIEAGKGIDCNGDTLNLVKRHGFYEVVVAPPKDKTTSSTWN